MLSITVLRSFLLYSFVCDSPNDCTHFVTVWSLLNWKLHFGQPANSKRPQQFQKINSQFILTKKPEPRKCATCSNRSIGCIYAIAKQSKAKQSKKLHSVVHGASCTIEGNDETSNQTVVRRSIFHISSRPQFRIGSLLCEQRSCLIFILVFFSRSVLVSDRLFRYCVAIRKRSH